MRVIAGKAKGHKLVTPDGLDVRPTLDRVKESVFSSLLPYIEDACVLDLFSGSGGLGIEALSRGAEYCDFVDISKRSVEATKENLRFTRMETRATVHFSDWKSFIKTVGSKKYNLVLLDPPYSKGIEDEVMSVISGVLKDSGIVMLETENEPKEFYGFEIMRSKRYGRVVVTYYKKSDGIDKSTV